MEENTEPIPAETFAFDGDAAVFRSAMNEETGHVTLFDVEVFRAGSYPQGEWSPEEVASIATNYNPAWLQAPITPDHYQAGEAWGWVESVRAESGVLYATFTLRPYPAYAVRDGAYATRSVEIYRKTALPNGSEGPYLKAISLLGACEPAVRGMAPIQFSAVTTPTQEGATMGDQTTPPVDQSPPPGEVSNFSTVTPTIDAANFAALNERLALQQAELDSLRAEQFRRDHQERFNAAWGSALSDGRVAPANRAAFEAIYHGLPASDSIQFAGQSVNIREAFLALFSTMPVLVSTGRQRVTNSGELATASVPRYGSAAFDAEVERRALAAFEANPTIDLRSAREAVTAQLLKEAN